MPKKAATEFIIKQPISTSSTTHVYEAAGKSSWQQGNLSEHIA